MTSKMASFYGFFFTRWSTHTLHHLRQPTQKCIQNWQLASKIGNQNWPLQLIIKIDIQNGRLKLTLKIWKWRYINSRMWCFQTLLVATSAFICITSWCFSSFIFFKKSYSYLTLPWNCEMPDGTLILLYASKKKTFLPLSRNWPLDAVWNLRYVPVKNFLTFLEN